MCVAPIGPIRDTVHLNCGIVLAQPDKFRVIEGVSR